MLVSSRSCRPAGLAAVVVARPFLPVILIYLRLRSQPNPIASDLARATVRPFSVRGEAAHVYIHVTYSKKSKPPCSCSTCCWIHWINDRWISLKKGRWIAGGVSSLSPRYRGNRQRTSGGRRLAAPYSTWEPSPVRIGQPKCAYARVTSCRALLLPFTGTVLPAGAGAASCVLVLASMPLQFSSRCTSPVLLCTS